MSRGRSKDLIQKRDQALLKRYYYWTEVQRRRFDDTLKILSEQEFFISEDRIMAIIRENFNRLPHPDPQSAPLVKKPKNAVKGVAFFSED